MPRSAYDTTGVPAPNENGLPNNKAGKAKLYPKEVHPKINQAFLCAPTPLHRQEAFYIPQDVEQAHSQCHFQKEEGCHANMDKHGCQQHGR